MLECVRSKKTNAILSFDGSPPDVFFHFSSGISVDVSLSRFHQTTLSLLSLVEPALTSLGLMCTAGQGMKSRMHVINVQFVLAVSEPHFFWSDTEMGKEGGASSSTNKLLSSMPLLCTAVTRWVRECKTA